MKRALCICLGAILLLTVGCGGGGSSESGGITSGPVEVVLAPVKIFREGSSSALGMFAAARGSGVTGGRIEDSLNNRLLNSDLIFENAANRYQVLLESGSGGFQAGTYNLKYFVGGETLEYKRENIEWTTIPDFNTALNLSWNPTTRYLTVSAPTLPGNVRYRLELYDADSGFFRRQTEDTMNPVSIVEYVAESGNYRVAVSADIIESGQVKARCLYFFLDTVSNY